MRRPALIAAFCLSLMSAHAYADIYAYIDEQGNPHFSTEKVDERYQLFMRGDKSFDTSQLAPTVQPTLKTPLMRTLVRHPNLEKYEALLNQAATEFSLDPALLKAVMAAESGFNPAAVSNKGAIGLMQVMPATAERYGMQSDRKKSVAQKLADPKTNIRLGARYLRDLHQLFPHKLELVLASYNAGEGAVQKYQNKIPPYPETRNYVQLVTQFYQLYKPFTERSADGARSSTESVRKRVHMTIPGRSNMPTAPVTTLE
jgi:soluble lytic murein transglycosylase-like protein